MFDAAVDLDKNQRDAVRRMKNGCVLCGDTGSGKTRTALAYYDSRFREKSLYIITTARKRDDKDWEDEADAFSFPSSLTVDSWNNIAKYVDIKGAFFIFDEQRVVGNGVWVKSFLRIAKANKWVLLSATPGDTWTDYIPLFIANGFYRNRSDFLREHVIYKPYSRYPQIDRYVNRGKLIRERNDILVTMDVKRETVPHCEDIYVPYDVSAYKSVIRDRWNVWEDAPIRNASELCYCLRRVCNSDNRRLEKVLELSKSRPRLIIFYNFDYELELLRGLPYGRGVKVAEWNGHKHEGVPKTERWIYLVQYMAGSEAWNCVTTDTIIFYSQNYSYKTMKQSRGRIDRRDTPYVDLWYYTLKSRSGIDIAISKALSEKRKFNESAFVGGEFG